MNPKKLVIVIAGPNGAGKSSFYDKYLNQLQLPYINADKLAVEMFGRPAVTDAEALASAKQADAKRRELIQTNASFVFETVLSDSKGAKIKFLQEARTKGYFIEAIFIGLSGSMLSRARVMQRVVEGGHDVSDDKLDARFPRTLENLLRLIEVVDRLTLYDNSLPDEPFRKVAVFENGQLISRMTHPPKWTNILDLPRRDLPTTKILPKE